MQVARRLGTESDVLQVTVVTRAGSIVEQGLRDQPEVKLLALNAADHAELVRRLAWEAFALPRLVRRHRAPVVLTWSGMLPRHLPAPVTCYLANPLMFARGGAANTLRRTALARTTAAASHVVAPSAAMASVAAGELGRAVEVVPLGVDHERFSPGDQPGRELLCVADFYPHKRHDIVLDAWARLPEPRPLLRLIGDPRVDLQNYRAIAALAREYRRLGPIEFGSELPLSQLVKTYRSARILVLVSEHESFAMPLLEAQACGVPAVVRDLPALRETGGDGAAYVRGNAAEDWAAQLSRLIDDESAHRLARERALDHARAFSWERTAREMRERLLD